MKADKTELNSLVKKYYITGHFEDKLYNFMEQATREIANQGNFRNYSDIDEFKDAALYKLSLSLINRKFNPEKGNFFSFASTVIHNTFISEIKKLSTRRKYTYIENMVCEDECYA